MHLAIGAARQLNRNKTCLGDRRNRGRQGPRIVTSGPKLDGPNPVWPGSIPISTVEDAKAAVARVKNAGADFVKVYNSAILAEGKRLGMRVTGYLTEDVLFSRGGGSGSGIRASSIHPSGLFGISERDKSARRSASKARDGDNRRHILTAHVLSQELIRIMRQAGVQLLAGSEQERRTRALIRDLACTTNWSG